MVSKIFIGIIEIKPEAVYENTVYTRTIVGRFQDVTNIKLFDDITFLGEDTAAIGKDRINDVLDVSIGILPKSGVRNVSDKTVGIYPSENPSGKWSYDFIGEIIDIDVDSSSILLDIGIGTVETGLNEELRHIIESNDATLGDCLYVPASRTDLEVLME